jgi:hypothetical protein
MNIEHFNAEEARNLVELSKEQQLEEILIRIFNAAFKGESYLISPVTLTEYTEKKIIERGFKVEKSSSGYSTIRW